MCHGHLFLGGVAPLTLTLGCDCANSDLEHGAGGEFLLKEEVGVGYLAGVVVAVGLNGEELSAR